MHFKTTGLATTALFTALVFMLTGCGAKKDIEEAYEAEKAKAETQASSQVHDHDHDECDDHDHDDDDHHHHHDPLYGGVLVELGDHVGNVEFLLQEDGTLTAYVLDAHAESAVRITQPSLVLQVRHGGESEEVTLEAVANPLTGETVGDTSEFTGQVPSLAGKSDFEVELKNITYKGITFENIVFSYSAEKE